MRRVLLRAVSLGVISLGVVALGAPQEIVALAPPPLRVLVFSKTSGPRHESIDAGRDAIRELGSTNGFVVDATEDASSFAAARLSDYDAVVFLSTTGDVLTAEQQGAFEEYIRNGGGYVGIHAASGTEYDWPWYGGLVGAYFLSHPVPQDATLSVEDRGHESTAHLGETWERFDEWYDFQENPRDRVHVLLSVDPNRVSGSQTVGDHPIAWCHDYDGGHAWYTALGHTNESWVEPEFLQHVRGGILTAAGIVPADCSVEAATVPTDVSPSPPSVSPSPPSVDATVAAASTDRVAPRVTSTRKESSTPWTAMSVVAGSTTLVAVAAFTVRRRRPSR